MAESEGIWRQGALLVVHKNARWPDRCVKTNQPAEGHSVKICLRWHHPAIYLIILAGLLPYVIVALIVQKTAVFHAGMAPDVHRRYRLLKTLAAIALLAAGILFVFAIARFEYYDSIGRPERASIMLLSSLVLFIVGLVVLAVFGYPLRPAKIEGPYVWLKGVHPEFVASFPDVNAQRPQSLYPPQA